MLSERELSAAIGSTAYDGSGDKIGTVEHFFVDDRTGAPTWVAVATGLFGTRTSVIPADDATFADGAPPAAGDRRGREERSPPRGRPPGPGRGGGLREHYGVTSSGGGMPPTPPRRCPPYLRRSRRPT